VINANIMQNKEEGIAQGSPQSQCPLTPKSRHQPETLQCPLSAKSGHCDHGSECTRRQAGTPLLRWQKPQPYG